jgi:hypothetical protein
MRLQGFPRREASAWAIVESTTRRRASPQEARVAVSESPHRSGREGRMPRRMSPATQLVLTIASVAVIVAGAIVWYTHYLQYVAR